MSAPARSAHIHVTAGPGRKDRGTTTVTDPALVGELQLRATLEVRHPEAEMRATRLE
jgi:hypothetical protein